MRIGYLPVHPISDGTFVARPSYFGPAVASDTRSDVFNQRGTAWLPIGCFLIRTADRVVFVDAGLGPQQQQLADGMQLVGGQLLTGLAAVGTAPENITDVVCTHLHSDHIGWLFDLEARPVFGYATIWFGASDWDHFVNGPATCIRTSGMDSAVCTRPCSGRSTGMCLLLLASQPCRLLDTHRGTCLC